jgi:hypothetical protein
VQICPRKVVVNECLLVFDGFAIKGKRSLLDLFDEDALNLSVLKWKHLLLQAFHFIKREKWSTFCCLHNMAKSSGRLGYNES